MLGDVINSLLDAGAKPTLIRFLFTLTAEELNKIFNTLGVKYVLLSDDHSTICRGADGSAIWNLTLAEPYKMRVLRLHRQDHTKAVVACKGSNCPYSSSGKCRPVAIRGRPDEWAPPLTHKEKKRVALYRLLGLEPVEIQEITQLNINSIIKFISSKGFSPGICRTCGTPFVIIHSDTTYISEREYCDNCKRSSTSRTENFSI